jgi:predicted phosphate transport protein (TIGR00153 family)
MKLKAIFGQSKKLESKIEDYFNQVMKSILIFQEGVFDYLDGNLDGIPIRAAEIATIKEEASVMRREIEEFLYREMLIPDARGDVMELLESMGKIAESSSKILGNLAIEKPDLTGKLRSSFQKLIRLTVHSIDELKNAAISYFTNVAAVKSYTEKVYFYENEVDHVEVEIKNKVFSTMKIERLSHKMQIRYFAEKIAALSDKAEQIADRLNIYVIKQSI